MTIDDNRPWWKEPMLWLVLGLPAIAVVGSFTSYYFAARDPDTLVKTEYRKVGLAMVEPANSAAGVAAALGLSARLTSGSGRVELVLRGHLATPPERLSLSVLHPAHENMDIHILLAHIRVIDVIKNSICVIVNCLNAWTNILKVLVNPIVFVLGLGI